VDAVGRLRRLCLSLPEAFEVEAWEHPTYRVGSGKGKMFAIGGDDPARVSLKADPEEREALLQQGRPYFLPPYVGPRGWVGVQLELTETAWDEVAELVATSYCLTAPKRLAARPTEPPPIPS
jgi:predicted DNA-binding protein (MmcQ/YjbR family)